MPNSKKFHVCKNIGSPSSLFRQDWSFCDPLKLHFYDQLKGLLGILWHIFSLWQKVCHIKPVVMTKFPAVRNVWILFAVGKNIFLNAPRAVIDHNQAFGLLTNISSTEGCKRFLLCLAVKYSKNARPYASLQVNINFWPMILRVYKQLKRLLRLYGNHQVVKYLFLSSENKLYWEYYMTALLPLLAFHTTRCSYHPFHMKICFA